MDKNAIKKYAVWARTELITRVSQRAEKYDITAEADASASSVNGVLLSDAEIKQRKALIEQVKQKGFDQVMEEVAYTWFNRFIALRFMEVNGYLPSHIRVFTDDNNNFKPQILAEAIHLELDGLDMEKVYEMKNNNENDELYKYLIITQCNDLSKVLPGMFQKIADYTELLFPDNVLREGSVIEQMVTQISEDDWKDQVQIVGWLYQYYNTEPKDKVFSDLKKNVKISKDKIPAATQLFTPDWIVRYMVENSLGKLWIEGHPDSQIKDEWRYYLDEAIQDVDTQKKLDVIRNESSRLKPEDILCIDPCSGSGHILAYIFDLLIKIYEDYGISTRDAVRSIVRHNIWGLDIDDRAAQLAYFSVMMKCVQYDRRFLHRKDENGYPDVPQPNVLAICESNSLNDDVVDYFCNGNNELRNILFEIKNALYDAKEYGSIINLPSFNYKLLESRFDEINNDISLQRELAIKELRPLVKVAKALSQKYHVVVTNPPYMGASGMNEKLSSFVKKNYAECKTDLFAVFITAGNNMTLKNGFNSMVTMQSWMFLTSFEKMRKNILKTRVIVNLMHMDNMVMHIAFGTAVTVFRNAYLEKYQGTYNHIKLADITEDDVPIDFPIKENRFSVTSAESFSYLPGNPIAYWISNELINDFKAGEPLEKIAYPRQGMATTNNNRFLRLWFEVQKDKIGFSLNSEEDTLDSIYKWFPYNKGGEYRKWYGNNDYIVNFKDKGKEVCDYIDSHSAVNHTGRVINRDKYFKPSVTWSKVSSGSIAFRYKPKGFIFDVAGTSIFGEESVLSSLMGFLNSKVTLEILACLSPTLNYEVGHISSIPVLKEILNDTVIQQLSEQNVQVSREDWDSFETSWDFKKHPLIQNTNLISVAFEKWKTECEERFELLKNNEEQLNKRLIDVYGLENYITPDVELKNITVYRADLKKDIKSLISYAVGCMFGRYSLDEEGVVYAGGQWHADRYKKYQADIDGIIPICDDEYFDDDIVGLFVNFISTVYGEEKLEDNLRFIATALGGKGSSREVIREYFINDFYTDHCSTYCVAGSGKRPIYWLFDSGKNNGFKCLVYAHRYQPDLIARVRTDYVHEQQSRYRTAIEEIQTRLMSASGSDKVRLEEKLTKLNSQSLELHSYEEKIHHLADQMICIDLDDGIKENYAKFQDVLAKIK